MTITEKEAVKVKAEMDAACLAWNLSDGCDLSLRDKAEELRYKYDVLCNLIDTSERK